MLRTRLWMGVLLAAGMGGVLLADDHFAPWYPILFACVIGVSVLATWEFLHLLPADDRPRRGLLFVAVPLIAAGNWLPVVVPESHPFSVVLTTFAATMLVAVVVELALYAADGTAVRRAGMTVLVLAYLGILPAFLIRLRWLPADVAPAALAATIFVPKVGDIGAYTLGRLFGRHPMAPALSPKKTWEGFAGGMLAAVGTAFAAGAIGPLFPHGWPQAVAFGLLVGVAGVLGDLAESMLKRECGAKDASHRVPGFGGVLDVIDSVLFAAPIAYLVLSVR